MGIQTILLTTTGSGIYYKPSSVRKIIVEGWGAGGSGSNIEVGAGVPFDCCRVGYGGVGGNYAKTTLYYKNINSQINYVVSSPTGGGASSASVWYDIDGTTPRMLATRGNSGPKVIWTITGSTVYSRLENGTEVISNFAGGKLTASIAGCIGDIIYKGGDANSWGPQTVTAGGDGGGGAGSTGNGKSAFTESFTSTKPGGATADFGGAGAEFDDLTVASVYGGGGASGFGTTRPNGTLGAQGLIRLTVDDSPLLSKIEWNGNTLLMGYELDNATSYSTTIDGSAFIRTENGTEYSWIPNTNYVLEGDVRWIPTTSTSTQTGWDGATGWRAFLEYARAKNKFNFYIDANEASFVESYLVEPLNGQHDLEIDGTRRIRLVIRNTTTPYDGY